MHIATGLITFRPKTTEQTFLAGPIKNQAESAAEWQDLRMLCIKSIPIRHRTRSHRCILPFNREMCTNCHYTSPTSEDPKPSQMDRSRRPAVAATSLFASTVRSARWQRQDEGGFCAVIPALCVSGGELKKALDSMFLGQYSVQVQTQTFTPPPERTRRSG